MQTSLSLKQIASIHGLSTGDSSDLSTLHQQLKQGEDELSELSRNPARLTDVLGMLDPAEHSLAWLYIMYELSPRPLCNLRVCALLTHACLRSRDAQAQTQISAQNADAFIDRAARLLLAGKPQQLRLAVEKGAARPSCLRLHTVLHESNNKLIQVHIFSQSQQ